MKDKSSSFKTKGPEIFKSLVNHYGYTLEEIKTNQIRGQDWSVHLIYVNTSNDLKIVIKQEPYYTDYGFSFFIYKTGTEEYNILCNVEHHLRDADDIFLIKAYQDLFTTKETLDLISGKVWKKLNHIPFLTK